MRRLALSNKKIRGVGRRLRGLDNWAKGFKGRFPSGLTEADRYLNSKIPIHQALVEGPKVTRGIMARCAQALINACQNLIESRPPDAPPCRITCVVCLPDTFTSEICIYLDEAYFNSHVAVGMSQNGQSTRIQDHSLTNDLGLNLPLNMAEFGIHLDNRGYPDPNDWFVADRWYFGEVRLDG